MDKLTELLEALLMSLAVVGSAALQMLLGVWILICAFVIIFLLRWGASVAYHASVAAWHRAKRR